MKGEKGEAVGGGYYDQRYGGIAGPPGPPGPQVRIKGSLYRSTFTFTFSHLADAFVQSDVQGREQSS